MKKKILFSLLAIGILLVLAVIPVFGGTYTGTRTFTIADTSGTSRTNVVALVPITGDSLISAGQINSDGTNTNVDSSSVDVPYTMDTTVMPVFVGDLGAGETKTFNLRTGYAPVQTNFPIIVGDGGILTTPYNPKLELGTYFSVEVNAPINMDAGGTIWSTGGVYVTTGSDTVFAVVNETGGTVNLSLSGVSGASPHDVIFSGNGSLYTLTVDGVSTTATETTGIPYWGYDFVWNNGGAMPYINYIKVSTLQTTATFTIPSATDATVYNDGSYIYIGAGGQILKTSLSLGVVLASYIVPETAGNRQMQISSMTSDGTYLYAGVWDQVNNQVCIFKLNKSDLSYNNKWYYQETAPFTPNNGASLAIDSTYVYVGGNLGRTIVGGSTEDATVWQVTKSDMTLHQTWSDTSDYIFAGIVIVGGNLYVGEVRNIAKVETSGMTTVGNYGWNEGNGIYGITYDGTNIVAVVDYGTIRKIDPSSMTLVDSVNLGNEWEYYSNLSYDTTTGDYYLWSNYGGNMSIAQLDSSFNIIGSWTPYPDWMASNITTLNGDIYVISYAPQIYKINGTTMATEAAGIYFSGTPTTEILWYQPSIMLSDTTVPDIDETQDGIITWGTNTALTIDAFAISGVPSGEVNAGVATDTSKRWVIPSFSETLVNVQDKLSKLPFFDMFAHASSDVDSTHPNGGGTNPDSNSGITVYGLYTLMGGAVVLSLGAWIALLTGSRIVLLMSLVIMMSIFVAPLFSAWMVIVLIIGGISILYLVRQG